MRAYQKKPTGYQKWRLEEMVTMVAQGFTRSEIAARFDVTPDAVTHLLAANRRNGWLNELGEKDGQTLDSLQRSKEEGLRPADPPSGQLAGESRHVSRRYVYSRSSGRKARYIEG